jgi:DNA-directed RNA polymerase specialized sigma24 family protein
MQKLFSLNDLYTNYTAGRLGRKEFEGAIFQVIQENMRYFGFSRWNKEDCDDYLSSLYLRISRSIDTYQETGSSFETYIGNIVRLSAKTFRSRLISDYLEENAAWITQIPDMYACESETEYNGHSAEEPENPIKPKNPRQLLILLLKCCHHVSTDFLERIAPTLDIEPEILGEMITHLSEQREKRRMEITMLREKINHQFYQCILYEKKLRIMATGSIAALRMKKKLEMRRDRLDKIRKRLARMRPSPSNFQIAKLLGISKGTVDAVLYNLRMRGLPCLNNDQQNIG